MINHNTMEVHVIESRPLTVVPQLPKETLYALCLDLCHEFEPYQDYVMMDITVGGEPAAIYHGFPGDAPVGAVVIDGAISLIGNLEEDEPRENDDPRIAAVKSWYRTLTEGRCVFKDDFWYCEPREN